MEAQWFWNERWCLERRGQDDRASVGRYHGCAGPLSPSLATRTLGHPCPAPLQSIRYRELSERGDTSRFAFGPLAIRSWANPWGFSSDFPPRFARQAVPPWTDYRGATSCRSSQPGAKSQGQVARKKKQQLGFLGRHNVFGMSGVGSKSEARDGRDWRSRYHGCAAFANRSETANYRRGGDSNPR